MAVVRSRLLRPHARADVIVCAKHHQSGDRFLYCIAFLILLATGIGSPDGVGQFFTRRHSGHHVNIYYCGNISFGHGWRYRHCQFMTSRLPGSLKQMRGNGCLSWQPNDSAWFRLRHILWPRFILSLLVLMQSSFYNLKTIICTDRSITISQTAQYKFNCGGGHHYQQIIW